MKTAIDFSHARLGIVGIALLAVIVTGAGFSANSVAPKRRPSGLPDDGFTQALHDSLMHMQTDVDLNNNSIPDSLERRPFNTFNVTTRPGVMHMSRQPRELLALIVAPRAVAPGSLVSIYVSRRDIDLPDTISVVAQHGRVIASALPLDHAGGQQRASWRVPATGVDRATIVVRTPQALYQARLRITP